MLSVKVFVKNANFDFVYSCKVFFLNNFYLLTNTDYIAVTASHLCTITRAVVCLLVAKGLFLDVLYNSFCY